MKRISAITVTLIVIICCFIMPAFATDYYAHKGDVSKYPPNTLPAFAEAAVEGYFGIEMDVYPARSGLIVVSHSTIKEGKDITEMTEENRGEYTYCGYPVPTLQEALHTIRTINPLCIAEVDIRDKSISEEDLQTIVDACGKHNVALNSSDANILIKLQELIKNKTNIVLFGCTSKKSQEDRTAWVNWCGDNDIRLISFKSNQISDLDIQNCHEKGILARARWVFTEEQAQALVDRGVDALITEEPLWLEQQAPSLVNPMKSPMLHPLPHIQ